MTAHRQGENELLLGLLKGPIFIPGPVLYKCDKFCVVFTALITSMFKCAMPSVLFKSQQPMENTGPGRKHASLEYRCRDAFAHTLREHMRRCGKETCFPALGFDMYSFLNET